MTGKLKKCKSCGKEISRSAKTCPHCGAKLKMGFLLKMLIVVAGLIAVIVAVSPSTEQKAKTKADLVADLRSTPPENISAAELADIFSLGTKSTKIQQDNKIAEIKGKVVQWTLPVFNVTKTSDDVYRIQTSSRSDVVGTFADVSAQSAEEVKRLTSLVTGDLVTVKGRIAGVSIMRNIEVEPAILVK